MARSGISRWSSSWRQKLNHVRSKPARTLSRTALKNYDDLAKHVLILKATLSVLFGLRLTPTRHELSIDGTRYWAWCAFDVIGIFGALHVSGSVRSLDSFSGEILQLEFIAGILQSEGLIVFMADLPKCGPVCGSWCSKVNFFTSIQSAEAWGQANRATGSSISVLNLAPVAREVWSRFLLKETIYDLLTIAKPTVILIPYLHRRLFSSSIVWFVKLSPHQSKADANQKLLRSIKDRVVSCSKHLIYPSPSLPHVIFQA
jgi:hypothetical protein